MEDVLLISKASSMQKRPVWFEDGMQVWEDSPAVKRVSRRTCREVDLSESSNIYVSKAYEARPFKSARNTMLCHFLDANLCMASGSSEVVLPLDTVIWLSQNGPALKNAWLKEEERISISYVSYSSYVNPFSFQPSSTHNWVLALFVAGAVCV